MWIVYNNKQMKFHGPHTTVNMLTKIIHLTGYEPWLHAAIWSIIDNVYATQFTKHLME